MDFTDIVESRYATKKFTGKMIPAEEFAKLKHIIKFSASSYGLQPFRIHIITDPATKEKLAPAAWNQPQITTCSHLLVFEPRTDINLRINEYGDLMQEQGISQEGIDNYLGMMRGSVGAFDEAQARQWAIRQIYLAVGNAINGAKEIGYDSCPMEGFEPAKFQEILGLENAPATVVAVGEAADTPRAKIRYNDLFIDHQD